MEGLEYSYSKGNYTKTGPGTTVDAIYHKSIVPEYNGNPFIEAIPLPLVKTAEIARHYTVGLTDYTVSDTKLSSEDRRFLINRVRNVRFYLPFERDLERAFYESLVSSYSLRRLTTTFVDEKKVTCLTADVGDSANSGFAILGYSGCGKSSSIKILTSRYPQVIYHEINGNKVPQILYLSVSFTSNNNFSAIYESIAKEIDKVLGVDNYYKKICRKKTIDAKEEKLSELLQGFNVGLIFIDEIQLMQNSTSKGSTFESLMTLTNKTKVAFAVIGTEDGYDKLFKNIRNVRRVGRLFNASDYCEREDHCNFLITSLFKYQWFDEIVVPDQSLMRAFREETKGIISFMVELYITVQDEYLKSRVRPKVDANFVRKIAKERFGNISDLLNDLDNPVNQAKMQSLIKESGLKRDLELDAINQQKSSKEIIKDIKEIDVTDVIHTVVSSISALNNKWDKTHIEAICKEVIGNKKHSDIDAEDVAEKVFKKLKDEGKQVNPKRVKNVDMINEVLKDI